MAVGESSFLLTIFRSLITFFYKKGNINKRLEARVVGRAIVAELPNSIPFSIQDIAGNQHRGVYVVGLMVWNKGNSEITKDDFIKPLCIVLEETAELINVELLVAEDPNYPSEMIESSYKIIEKNKFEVYFDCINPKEFILCVIYLANNPQVNINVLGRIRGQDQAIDQTALEVKARVSERFLILIILLFILNAFTLFFVVSYYLFNIYEIREIFLQGEKISSWLMIPFFMGLLFYFLFIFSRITYWLEKCNVPEGYPLSSDLEPPFWQNVKGMLTTLFKGKKQRISLSIFNRGKPILMPSKTVRKRSVNDWIKKI